MSRALPRLALLAAFAACAAPAQVIEFESNGLKYQTLSKEGVTVMFAHLPAHLRDYEILQIAISNGSPISWTVRPEDLTFTRNDGTALRATPARTVVDGLLAKASGNDVIHLVTTYENTLNGMTQFRSTNGYEQRRQAALAALGGNRLKAAAAASAIAFVQTKLAPGESTDGAAFFFTGRKPLGEGTLTVRAGGQTFQFNSEPSSGTTKALEQRSERQ